MLISPQRRIRLLIGLLLGLTIISTLFVSVAFAASWSVSADTWCYSGRSVLTWSGYNFWDWGETHAWLWWWNGSSWSLNGDADSGQVYGDSNTAAVIANRIQQGMHWVYWQGTGSSISSFFSGQQNAYGNTVQCP